ncbi:photosystem I reaction center subunit XI [Desmonostoc muscorum]|uniref:photosystem I reaction center subunit XI n=1 Tax=Desmonostoc muscorum TaxID=1179 RepID=UPI0035A0068F
MAVWQRIVPRAQTCPRGTTGKLTAKCWSEFNAGWTVGSCGGALFAFLLLTNSSLFF